MNIGLVLSGGMAKGAYQIGALKALSNFVPLKEIKHISCASVGTLNGYAFATGSLGRAEQLWKNISSNDSRLVINQMLRSSMLQQNIKSIYDSNKKLPCNLYCSLLDLDHRTVVYRNLAAVSSKQIPMYLKASVAAPIYNRAVQISASSYYDGAMVDNIPLRPLMKHNLDYIICIYFDDVCFKFENPYFDNKIIKITFPSKSLMSKADSYDQENVDRMIQDGYDRTTFLLRAVFAEGYENTDNIYRTIEYMNQYTQNSCNLRMTEDAFVTKVNRVTQKLTKTKIL
ncbi:MAG: patatin-like phospholipase family protein [Clostridia bacterium]|nr:patatin-like phospholipase family protein [Clostridia bacterium]